jgi:hypothetical protein
MYALRRTMLPCFNFFVLHYIHSLTHECHISESGSRCVIGKWWFFTFYSLNGESQALLVSLYLVLESNLKYPAIGRYNEKFLVPWIFTLMICCFIGPGINLAFLVKGYMGSLYTFCSTGRIVREKLPYTLQTLHLILFCSVLKHLYSEVKQDALEETLLSCIKYISGDWKVSWSLTVTPHIFQEVTSN